MKRAWLAAGMLFALPAAASASDGCPADAELTVRNGHAMAFDARRGAVLLFGGADERRVLADLWAWNGQEWRCLAVGGPPPRTFPALAWDGVRERLILFGGNAVLFGPPDAGATFLDDMWEWDGRRWRALAVPVPGPRAEASATWDAGRRRVVLFGGYHARHGERVRLGDTWEWDGVRWSRVSEAGPAARNGSALAYDPERAVSVLFGGNGPAPDTWAWDGRQWTLLAADAAGRFNPAMAYDPGQRALIRFGGWTGVDRAADTWRFDDRRWSRIAGDGPAARNHTAMALDAERGVIVLFGGHDGERVFGDTWEWAGGHWTRVTERLSRRRVDNGH